MGKFCVKCGAPLNAGPFCAKCGTDMRSFVPSTSESLQPVVQMPCTPGAQPVSPAPAKQGMSTLAKIGIVAAVIIFVGGAAGAVSVYYVAHRVSQKIHQTANSILGSTSEFTANSDSKDSVLGKSESDRSANSGTMGDVCRLLSKQEVSKAVGVEIVRAESKDDGCSYMAKGTQQEMTAKHAAAMLGDKGADKKTQQITEQFASDIFKMTQSDRSTSEQNASGEVPVFNFSLDPNAAEEQMTLNAKTFALLGNQERLPGIGDQAFVSADGMIMIRKGKTLVRIMYLACPCGLEQVKPLAKEIADAL